MTTRPHTPFVAGMLFGTGIAVIGYTVAILHHAGEIARARYQATG